MQCFFSINSSNDAMQCRIKTRPNFSNLMAFFRSTSAFLCSGVSLSYSDWVTLNCIVDDVLFKIKCFKFWWQVCASPFFMIFTFKAFDYRPHTTVKNTRNVKSVSRAKLPYFERIFKL